MRQLLKEILTFDKEASGRLRLTPGEGILWYPAVFFAHSGDSWFWMAGLGFLWLFGNEEWRFRAASVAVCIVIQALVVFVIKFTIRRSRPKGEWGAIYRNTDPHSFPSGHATRAFLLVSLFYGLGPQMAFLVVLAWAPLVSLARVLTGVHYISDVVAGMALGLVFGWLMLYLIPWLPVHLPFLYAPLF
jgi:membrane-associated phospholipid phosphatase